MSCVRLDAAYVIESSEHGRNCREHVKINYIIGHLEYTSCTLEKTHEVAFYLQEMHDQ